ncbi:hypothetical protein ABZ342_28900 [Amycolatopsis sp. NPDC005961]|uniref:hypothetical protein n=1 Tax=Amycolatopsis sp. NPDC005961 TaxID=3156720 RepID=UPI0033D45914
MASSHPRQPSIGGHVGNRSAKAGISVVSALIVAAGAKGAFEISNSTMMMNIASVGAWVMLCLGLAYAGVRIRPAVGGALLVGVGMGVLLVVIFGGMQMLG